MIRVCTLIVLWVMIAIFKIYEYQTSKTVYLLVSKIFFFLLHLRSREGRSTSKVEHHRISQAYMLYSRAYKHKAYRLISFNDTKISFMVITDDL